jgi:hypothetical protein
MTINDLSPPLREEVKEGSSSLSAKYRIYEVEQAYRHVVKPRSEREQLLYMMVDDVLFYVWDACCLSITEEYREEYLPYLPTVFDLLCGTEDGLDLYDYLVFVEETKYSMLKNDTLARSKASRVVDHLLACRKTILMK